MADEAIDEELRVKLDAGIKKCSIGDKKEKDFDIFSIYLCDCKKRPAEEK